MAAALTGLFGLLVLVGGVVGYVNTGSVPSLIAGSSFGLLLAASAYLINNKKTQARGYLLSLVLLGVLSAVMVWRYTLAFKFFPAGLVALLSIALFVHNFVRRGAVHKAKK